jgi:hypothetical protein
MGKPLSFSLLLLPSLPWAGVPLLRPIWHAPPSPAAPSRLPLSWAGQASAAQPGLFLPPLLLSRFWAGSAPAAQPLSFSRPAKASSPWAAWLARGPAAQRLARPLRLRARAEQLPSRRRLCAWDPSVSPWSPPVHLLPPTTPRFSLSLSLANRSPQSPAARPEPPPPLIPACGEPLPPLSPSLSPPSPFPRARRRPPRAHGALAPASTRRPRRPRRPALARPPRPSPRLDQPWRPDALARRIPPARARSSADLAHPCSARWRSARPHRRGAQRPRRPLRPRPVLGGSPAGPAWRARASVRPGLAGAAPGAPCVPSPAPCAPVAACARPRRGGVACPWPPGAARSRSSSAACPLLAFAARSRPPAWRVHGPRST